MSSRTNYHKNGVLASEEESIYGRSDVSNYRSGVDNWRHVVERRMSAAVWCQD